MSMISSLIDELRKLADGQATYREARVAMLEAADTIWELRDDLQQANAENAKLRDELAKWERLTANIELPEYPITEFKPKDLERENAKLRELVDYMTPIALYVASEQERNRMRELGIEVPE